MQNRKLNNFNMWVGLRHSLIVQWFFIGILFIVFSCNNSKKTLPILGPREVNQKGDTIYHEIANFELTNQDNEKIDNDYFKDKIYVADFFFTTCPTICPVMKKQMLRVYEKYKNNSNIAFLSTTIDPMHDSVAVLKRFKTQLGINGNQWQFVTGSQNYIYQLAQKSYMVSALEDKAAKSEGGFVHSGAFVLVDKNRHIRGIYDGTKEKEVEKLMEDMDVLLQK